MSYDVKKRASASKENAKFRKAYGAKYGAKLERRFKKLANEAEGGEYLISSSIVDAYKHSAAKFKAAGLKERMQMLVTAATKMQPPRDLRYSISTMRIYFEEVDIEVIYEVEHDNKRIVINTLVVPPRND